MCIWMMRSLIMRLSLMAVEIAMIAQTVSAPRATMLASLVRIFKWLSRFISPSGGKIIYLGDNKNLLTNRE